MAAGKPVVTGTTPQAGLCSSVAIACHALWDVVVMGLLYALAWALPARWRGKATLADGTESARATVHS